MAVEFVRRIEKVSTTPGAVPTVPPSADHTDGTWNATDTYEGELFWNAADSKLYVRVGSTAVMVGPDGVKRYSANHLLDVAPTVITHNLGVMPRVIEFWESNGTVIIPVIARSTTQITVDARHVVTVEVNIIGW